MPRDRTTAPPDTTARTIATERGVPPVEEVLAPHVLDIGAIRSVTTAAAPDRPVTPSALASSKVQRLVTHHLKASIVVADLIALLAALVLATVAYRRFVGGLDLSATRLIAVSIPVWLLIFAQQGLYQSRRLTRRMEEARLIVNASFAGVIMLAGMSVLFGDAVPRVWLAFVVVAVFLTVPLERELVRRAIGSLRRDGQLTRPVIIVGENSEAQALGAMLRIDSSLGYEVLGYVADGPRGPVDHAAAARDLGPYLGSAEHVLDMVAHTGSTGVIVATTGVDDVRANRLVRELTRSGLYVEMTSGMKDISTSRMTLRNLGGYSTVCVEPIAEFGWRTVAKRVFDVVVAGLILTLVSPVILVAAAAIRVTSGKGVLFRQTRVGRDGVPFTVYKLRTMVADAEDRLAELQEFNEAAGPMFKMKGDPRVTRIGGVLRATSIDELPQLMNVILGDMSLVGPRPALPSEAALWDDALRERLRVRPGITGMWQVSGRFTASLETYARLDLYYVDNWSFVTDLAIIARTIPAVLRRDGAV